MFLYVSFLCLIFVLVWFGVGFGFVLFVLTLMLYWLEVGDSWLLGFFYFV